MQRCDIRTAVDARQSQADSAAAQWGSHDNMENRMHALKDLFTSDVGLMSLGGIVFMLGMGVFFVRYFLKHMREDGEAAARAPH